MSKNLTQSYAELAEIARQGTQKISVDVSTLPGWANIAVGSSPSLWLQANATKQ